MTFAWLLGCQVGTTCSVRALPKPAPPRDQVTASSPNLNPAYISEEPDTWGSHSMRLATTRETSAVMFCGLSSIKALAPLTQNLPGRVTNTCHVCHSGPLRELVGLTVSTRVLPVSYSATSVFCSQEGIEETVWSSLLRCTITSVTQRYFQLE